MNWKVRIAILLFLPVCWWVELPPLWSAIDMAQHHVECSDDEHCDVSCPHPVSPIDPPHSVSAPDIPYDESILHEQLIALLPHPHLARDRPPPLFYSLSHSLRAPPTLMFA